MSRSIRTVLAAIAASAVLATGAAADTKLVEPSKLENTVTFDEVRVDEERIDGTIVNRSDRPVEDIEVLVHYNWLWRDEFNPGSDSPAWAEFVTVAERLEPGERAEFSYTPGERLPQRDDGWFMPTVSVVSATAY